MKKFLGLCRAEWIKVGEVLGLCVVLWLVSNSVAVLIPQQDSFIVLGLTYMSNGVLILLFAGLATLFMVNAIFDTLDRYIDRDGFKHDWAVSRSEVRVCATLFVVCWLLLCAVLAFKP